MAAKLFLVIFTILGFSQAQNPLAGLPSTPGSHVAQIQAMGDNTWLNLPAPAADAQYGKARGRSWGGYMAYAPDLEGAFIAGQGQHGYINPDGRYDDIFFYDVNANKWICIFPGVKTTTFVSDINAGNLKMRDDGQLVDVNGQPVPLSYGGHSYKSHIYAAGLRRWVTVICQGGIGGDQYSNSMSWYTQGAALLSAQMSGKTDSASGTPFFYNAATGQFERYHFNPLSYGGQGACNVFYLDSKQKFWYYDGPNAIVRFGDFTTHRWTGAGTTGSGPSGIDMGGCYDSRRDRIYMGWSGYGPAGDQNKVFTYDVSTNAWSSSYSAQNLGPSNSGFTLYDSVSDRVLSVYHGFSSTVTIGVLNPATMTWETAVTAPSGVANTSACWHGFYSPALNACFFYQAGDSYDNGVMWVYRYKRAVTGIKRPTGRVAAAFSASPNPFRTAVTLRLDAKAERVDIFDTQGRSVKSFQGPVSGQLVWNAEGLPSGIYTVRVKARYGVSVKKILLEK